MAHQVDGPRPHQASPIALAWIPFSWLLLLQLAVTTPEATVAARLDHASELAAAFALAPAAAAYEEVLDLDPANPEALIGLSRAYNDLGRGRRPSDEAIAHLETALRYARRLQEQAPDRPEGHFWVAATSGNLTAHRPAGEKLRLSREVEKNARLAVTVDPCFAPGWAALGIYDREVASLPWFVRAVAGGFLGGLPGGSLEESARKLGKAVALDPDSVYDHYQLGLTYEKMKQPKEAAEQFRLALSLAVREAQEPAAQADARERLARLAPAARPSPEIARNRATTLHNPWNPRPHGRVIHPETERKAADRGQRARTWRSRRGSVCASGTGWRGSPSCRGVGYAVARPKAAPEEDEKNKVKTAKAEVGDVQVRVTEVGLGRAPGQGGRQVRPLGQGGGAAGARGRPR